VPRQRRAETTGEILVRPAILVVDDDQGNRALVRAYLEDVYDIHEAADAASAFDLLKIRAIDLVLLDVMMPGVDGFEACRVMKRSFNEPYLPVLLVTALEQQEERNAGLEAGADDFLSLPVDRQELLFRVKAFIRIRQQDKRIRRQLQKLMERDRLIQQQLEELNRLSRVRRQWADELERANRELETFSYTVSHDLRAPLRAIAGFSEALETDHADRLDDQGRSHLARVRAATARMSALIEDLLDLSRISGGELHRQAVDLTDVSREVVEELRRSDPARHVTLEVEDGLMASADRKLVTIALENLLGNAWKFTSKSGEARIGVGRVVQVGESVFFVSDNGAGFDPDHVARLFQPFQRLHGQSEFAGTGIGLATVKRIVSRHGGRIWAEASIGKGATFFFTLAQVP
jgi:signal transduction histidine kinase